MKKLIFIITCFAFTVLACAQNIEWQSSNVGIRRSNPRLYFNGNWLGTSGNTGTTLYFNGVAVGAGGVTNWGAIGGILATQADLQAALDLKSGYPGAGIPVSNGATWGASINNNSANWNTAYGWGNHAAAGYYSGTSATIRGLISSSATGLTYTSATGVFSFTGGYAIPTMYSQNNWNTAYGWGDHAGLYDPVGTGAGLVALHLSAYNHNNYNTAYTDRLKWDGGATGLVAATGRTSLGGTTIGQAFFTFANPGAVVFFRGNANNSLSGLSAADFKTALSLQNVTNESKATMFTNSEFTGTHTIPTPFILGATSVTTTGTQFNYLNTATGTSYIDDALLFDSTADTLITKSEARTLIAGVNGYAASKFQFIVDTTANAPVAGDSILTHPSFIGKHVEVDRGAEGDSLFHQDRNLTAIKQIYHNGYRFNSQTGTLVFKPVLASGEHVNIVVTDSTSWTDLQMPYYYVLHDGSHQQYIAHSDYITLDEADSVVTWVDALGIGPNLGVGATPTRKPIFNGDSVTFNGSTNVMFHTTVISQPVTIYAVVNQLSAPVGWEDENRFFGDGDCYLKQNSTTPDISAYAGTASSTIDGPPIGTRVVIRVVFNGASSSLQVNADAAWTGNAGTNGLTGFYLGNNVNVDYTNCSNISVCELILSTTVDDATEQTLIYNYLKNKYGL